MTDSINWIFSIFNKIYSFLSNCKFSFFGYVDINLLSIFIVIIVLSVLLSIFWKGGKY